VFVSDQQKMTILLYSSVIVLEYEKGVYVFVHTF